MLPSGWVIVKKLHRHGNSNVFVLDKEGHGPVSLELGKFYEFEIYEARQPWRRGPKKADVIFGN